MDISGLTEIGYPISVKDTYNLGGTPLNDTILAMTTIVPKFKMDTGVQKVNTIFLTDGSSNRGNYVRDYDMSSENWISVFLCGILGERQSSLILRVTRPMR